MKRIQKPALLLLICVIGYTPEVLSRSPFRHKDPMIQTLTASWLDNRDEYYTFTSKHLECYPWFQIFDRDFFYGHLLPSTPMTYRSDPTKTVDPAILSEQIERLLVEIKEQKKRYDHFDILQEKDFNRARGVGLIVLKFKDYPFVVKLFLENPETLIDPWCKGIEPIFFFYMGGGVNRHLSGFTRPKNLEYIKYRLSQAPEWQERVDVPRKNFWIPKNEHWIHIEGSNIGGPNVKQSINIPSVYAIIADAIVAEKKLSIHNRDDRTKAAEVSNFLSMQIDPHIKNFMVEKGTGKLVIVDTEHFPTMVGFHRPRRFRGYFGWYCDLIGKCGKNMLFSTKDELQEANERCHIPYVLAAPQTPVAPSNVPRSW